MSRCTEGQEREEGTRDEYRRFHVPHCRSWSFVEAGQQGLHAGSGVPPGRQSSWYFGSTSDFGYSCTPTPLCPQSFTYCSVTSLTLPDARHKPEGAPDARPVGSGSSKSQITNQLAMSLEEAHLILNVKKEASMEAILEVSCCFMVIWVDCRDENIPRPIPSVSGRRSAEWFACRDGRHILQRFVGGGISVLLLSLPYPHPAVLRLTIPEL